MARAGGRAEQTHRRPRRGAAPAGAPGASCSAGAARRCCARSSCCARALDLDHGRPAHAAIELRAAYAAALAELPGERREDLAIRLAELEKLRDGVEQQARAALASPGELDGDVLRHALGRLEATLRARTAPGFRLK